MPQSKPPETQICEWTKGDLRKHFDQLCKIVAEPRFVCKKCGRVANRKKWLCDSKKLTTSPETAP